jgi:hypothetical protein
VARKKPFWRSWYFQAGVVVVLLVAAGYVVIVTAPPSAEEKDQAFFTQSSAKLAGAHTATIAVSGNFRRQLGSENVDWTGTTLASFTGDTAAWQTTFSPMAITDSGFRLSDIQLKAVHSGSQTVYSSPSFPVKDKRNWVDAKRTSIIWPTPLADMNLGLTDLNTWLPILGSATKGAARAAEKENGEMAAAAGAPNKFMLRCTSNCPPPWGTDIDTQFPDPGLDPILYAWFDDDGLLRQLRVTGQLGWFPELHEGESDPYHSPGALHGQFDYYLTFTFGAFGTPAAITAPVDDQIATDQYITVGK